MLKLPEITATRKRNQVEIQIGRLCNSSIEESESLEFSPRSISVIYGYLRAFLELNK